MTNLRVAVDIGGTFTDICILDETTGVLRIFKTRSTPDPIDGLLAAYEVESVATEAARAEQRQTGRDRLA